MAKKYLVLIVDDIKESRLLLRKIIKSMDYNIQEAANGKEGLEIARLHKPGLIISDILMPVMDGFQFCREVKKDDKLKNIPFIIYTATYTDKKDEEFAFSLGVERFIRKPTGPDKFIKIIQSVISNAKKGTLEPKKPIFKEEKEILKFYNERLINKLEKKTLDLEKEITERKQVEEKLNKINQLYATLIQINQAIIRERDKQKLLQEICNIAVEFGKFKLAWIGLVDEENKLIKPAAFSGEGSDYLKNIKISLTNDITRKGPTGRSIREGKSVVFNDLENNPDFAPWRKQALEKGYRSSGAFPIRLNNSVIGSLNVYAVETYFFDEDEIKLLEETVADISFALEKFREEDNRKQVEETLRIERDNLNNIFEAMEDGVYIVNQQYDIQYVNPVLIKEFGNYESRKCYEYFHDIKEVCPWCKNLEVFAGKTVRWEWYSIKNQRTYDLIDTLLKNPDGSISKLEIFRDITERKRTEDALRLSKEFSENLIETANSIILTLDKNANITTFNTYAENLTGYKKEDVLGKNLFELFIPEGDREKIPRVFKNVLRQMPDFSSYENPILIKNGSERLISWKNTVLKNKSGEPYGVLSIGTDITERKKIEDALKNSEKQLKIIFESAPDAYYINDLKGILLAGNKAAEKITGYKREELIGSSFLKLKLLSPKQLPKAAVLLAKNAMGQSTGPDEFILNRKDGTQVPVEIMTFPIKIKDKTRVLAIARDITKRKQAEKETETLQMRLQQAQKMEAVGTLAGGIAHDFNNILSAIIGYTEIALDDVKKETLLHSNLKEVFKAGRRAKDLVKQILAFSRQSEQERQRLQVKYLTKEALKLLRSSLPTTIEIRQDIQSDSVVLADPTQIHQVLMNLCTNAGSAMQEKGGVLDVKLKDVELDTEFTSRHPDLKPGLYVNLTVSDTGHGMSPKVLERIFDPFFTTKEKGEGTGMGLSVVHGIVKSYGGTITAYSEPGKGSTFNVFLPVTEAKAESEKKKEGTIPKGKERILCIDDEQVLVDLGKQMLESLGYKVTAKTSSVEALKLFKSQPDMFDLIITDMTMPSMTGEELAKEVLAIRPDIRVILCTGFSAKIDKEKAKSIGIRAFVMKPILKQQMAETVREVLDSKKEKGG